MSKQVIISSDTDSRLKKALTQINKNNAATISSEPMKMIALIDRLINTQLDVMVKDKKIKLQANLKSSKACFLVGKSTKVNRERLKLSN